MTKAKLADLREAWRERVAAFRASGQSGAAWCSVHEVKEHKLWYWVRRFRVDAPMQSSQPKFLPVQIQETKPVANTPVLVRVGSVAIEVQAGYDAQLLRDLVQTLTVQCYPPSPCLFVFCNRQREKLKILHWQHNGFWL